MNWVFQRIQNSKGASMSQSSSLLLGLDGVVVESVQIDDDRIRTVHVGTDRTWVEVCPLIHRGVSGEFPLWEGCFPWQGRQGGIRRS